MSPRNWILKGRRKPLVVSKNSEKLIYRHNSSQEGDKLCVDTGERCEKSLNQVDLDEYSRSCVWTQARDVKNR